MKTSDFDYELPPELIAQTPIEPRDSSRLLVVDRLTGELIHTKFREIDRFLHPGDILVMNQTRVVKARVFAHKATGGRVELLLLSRRADTTWEVLAGGKGVKVGRKLILENGFSLEVLSELDGARRMVRFSQPVEDYLETHGHVPLPPYIHEILADPERYQTIYARLPGSAAAPTAGLHFTPELLEKLSKNDIKLAWITLHVGLDTFAPVTEEDPTKHRIHSEWYELNAETAKQINRARKEGGRVIAIGTTSVRTLESAVTNTKDGDIVVPVSGMTSLFILPGYHFKVVEVMVTNFHLPRSTLIMMVSAFTGREQLMKIYQEAIRLKYRFYSFGDAMLIL